MKAVFYFNNGYKDEFNVIVKPVYVEMWDKENPDVVVGNYVMVIEDDKRFLINTDGMLYENLVLDHIGEADYILVDNLKLKPLYCVDDSPFSGRTSKAIKGNIVFTCALYSDFDSVD